MKMPKQPGTINPQRQALAPYNFVELPDKVVTLTADELPDLTQPDPARHCGQLNCILETTSPLYIRAGISPDVFAKGQDAKNQPDFFSTQADGSPVIPGSSLRGMVRALVEVVSFGKISAVNDEPLVYRAVGDMTNHGKRYRNHLVEETSSNHYHFRVQGGYIRKIKNEWHIQPAVVIKGASWAVIPTDNIPHPMEKLAGCKNASVIYVSVSAAKPHNTTNKGSTITTTYADVEKASEKPGPGLDQMVLVRSGDIFSKKSEAVIYPEDTNTAPLPLSDDLVRRYKEQITPDQRDKILGKELCKDGVLIDGQPVFYICEKNDPNQVFFFGHCRMLRLPYPRTPRDYIPENLRREEEIDLAEAIFGFTKRTGQKKVRAYAGRVFFSDARLVPGQQNIWLNPTKPVTLKILSGPKPTTFQHYLVQPDANSVIKNSRGEEKPDKLLDYASETPGETVIRGHKFYWHKGDVAENKLAESKPVNENDSQHTQVKPVRSGVKFTFTLRFENLSDAELGAVLWVLRLGAEEKLRLSLGMGKPLGMGAVKVTSELVLRSPKERWSTLFTGERWNTGELTGPAVEAVQKKVTTAFEKMVLSRLGRPDKPEFESLPVIQQLRALLNWPGPDPNLTRYMEIEYLDPQKGKINEYKLRPVLPVPTQVLPIPAPRPPAAGLNYGVVVDFGLGPNKSFGHIRPDKSQSLIFVHRSGLADGLTDLSPGQRVIYEITWKNDKNQNQAVNVHLESSDS